jgi:hypothetical protein
VTEISTTNLGTYDSRKVAIQVTGLYCQKNGNKSIYTVVVPYCRFNQTIQQISRRGGKIVNVTVQYSSLIHQSKTIILPPTTSAKPVIAEVEVVEKIENDTSQLYAVLASDEETKAPVLESTSQREIVTSTKKTETNSVKHRRKKARLARTNYSRKSAKNSLKGRGKRVRKKTSFI